MGSPVHVPHRCIVSAGEPHVGNGHERGPLKRTGMCRSVRVLTLRYSRLALVLLAAGCFYWGRRRVQEPTPVKPHAPVWIWSGGNVMKWHAVVISQDSVSGIPYRTSLKCDSCRRSMPRGQVDSMKLGYHTVAEFITFWGGLLILSGIAR